MRCESFEEQCDGEVRGVWQVPFKVAFFYIGDFQSCVMLSIGASASVIS